MKLSIVMVSKCIRIGQKVLEMFEFGDVYDVKEYRTPKSYMNYLKTCPYSPITSAAHCTQLYLTQLTRNYCATHQAIFKFQLPSKPVEVFGPCFKTL